MIQLYLHFPFCKRKCFYCDFCSAKASENEVERYVDALIAEVRKAGERFANTPVSTVYLGGGTPSIVPAKSMARVMRALHETFTLSPDAEITAEANPDSLTAEWLETLMSYGLNRLSLGVQATQDRLLLQLGRIHDFTQAQSAIRLARACGVQNLNLDLMFGLPTQTLSDYLETLETVVSLAPEHISAYSLIVEEGTPLHARVTSGEVALPEEDEVSAMYEQGGAFLQGHGYRRYEISNFAREGFACRHNIGYWQGAHYLGFGLAAHGMLPPTPEERTAGACRVRTENPTDMHAYLQALAEGRSPCVARQLIPREEARMETIMLGLRMVDGIDEAAFESAYGESLSDACGGETEALIQQGFARREGGRFALTERGLEVQNAVLLRLLYPTKA